MAVRPQTTKGDALTTETRSCAFKACGRAFDVTAKSRQRYCCTPCRAHAELDGIAARFPAQARYIRENFNDLLLRRVDRIELQAKRQKLRRRGEFAVRHRRAAEHVAPHRVTTDYQPGRIAFAVLYGDAAIGGPLGRSDVSEAKPLHAKTGL